MSTSTPTPAAAAGLELRTAEERDLRAMAELYPACYPAMKNTVEDHLRRLREGWMPLAQRTVAYAGDDLVGMYALLRFDLHLGGRAIPAGGLAGVAVAPHARGAGVAAGIVAHAAATCLAESRPACLLYPFREDFYHRLGWTTVYEQRRCRFPPRWLPLFDEHRLVRPATEADEPAIRRAHAAWCAATSGAISRDERFFEYLLRRHRAVVVPDGAGGLGGYLLYKYDAPSDERQAIEVFELVHLGETAHRALLGFLALQRDQVHEIRHDVALDDPFPALLVRTSAPPARRVRHEHADMGAVGAGAMLKLLDLGAALRLRGYQGEGELDLHVGGEAALRLRVAGGAVDVAARDGSAAGAVPALHTDAHTFARIYAGALRPSAAARLGLARLQGSDGAAADRLLALPAPLLSDTF